MLRNFIAFIRTGKTAKQRRAARVKEKLESLFGVKEEQEEQKPLNSYPVPEELIVEFITKDMDKKPSGVRALWQFIYANFPVKDTDHVCVNVENPTHPTIDVYAPEDPNLGRHFIVKPEDEDELFALWDKAAADEATTLDKYYFWKAVETKYPEFLEFKHGYGIIHGGIHLAIVDKARKN